MKNENVCIQCLKCKDTDVCAQNPQVDLTKTTKVITRPQLDPFEFFRNEREKQTLKGIEGLDD